MTLALIAGQGALPRTLAAALGGDPACYHLVGFAPEGLASAPFRVEHLGSFIAGLTAEGVTRVCLAGAIARPKLDPAAIDAATLPLVPRMMQALQAGDDGALRVVLSLFEEAGIEVVAAQDLAPDLLRIPEVGTPSDRDRTDIARAREVHAGLAALDVGQGCVVAGGQVLALEALPGTDWMLRSLAAPFPRPEGGVFFKAGKPAQDRRVDMATIGPETVTAAAAAGLSGIAVVQDAVLVLEGETLAERARAAGLFVAALPE
ncbi:LpxI family protein [Jannaschia marina]|uniref:LpxI family protein n=1 Tax=Jannaschia marina TaxID=2741674 RepID=UPI0015CAB9BB|nr:UDP-2,3-diacylglucosamine diphosphatase LpxI [Jannaschia marina]